MFSVAICDDDNLMLNNIQSMVMNEFEVNKLNVQVKSFMTGKGLLETCEESCYDIVFLDIDMPYISGFDIAEQIGQNTLIIFVTSHDELVYSSFKFSPFRFIRKSCLKDELPEAVAASISVIKKRMSMKNYEVRTGSGIVYIDLNRVEYIEIYGHWLRICVENDKPVECYGSLSDFEKNLEKHGFLRTHKSYLVNCKFIYSIEQKSVILDDKTEIPLSRYKADVIKEKVREYLGEHL